jgi:2-polyprenyl-3-methyl-5-hydroxy-6-metoxy-1,4-benzoquinol methylase
MPTPTTEKILTLLREAHTGGTLVKLTLGAHRGRDKTLENVFVRPVTLKNGNRLQFVYRHTNRDVTKNLSPNEALARIAEHMEQDFGSAHLFTTEFTAQWKRGSRRLLTGNPRHTEPADPAHDRPKQRVIAKETNWLQALEAKPDKQRQIQKFVEILSHLIELPKPKLRLVDMGCGKGYLTFAAYDWLRQHGWPAAEVTGIEQRAELVELCNRVARENNFTGLRFEAGAIDGYLGYRGINVLIALHACDTATDDAIAQGVYAGASLIIVAPCCHKELSRQLKAPPVLAGALKHGILHEREAELVTDSLRAALLEWQGYETKVFEFVSTEHTKKNLMIAAIKRDQPGDLQKVKDLAALYGIKSQRLAERLGLRLAG